jgi:hypothetical protein
MFGVKTTVLRTDAYKGGTEGQMLGFRLLLRKRGEGKLGTQRRCF